MEDIIKALNIKEIYYLDMIYKDKNDVSRTLRLDQYVDDDLKIVDFQSKEV